MQLPSHIIQLSSRWYFNTKNGKYIHSDKIVEYLKGWNANAEKGVKAKVSYKRNVKLARRRWDDQD